MGEYKWNVKWPDLNFIRKFTCFADDFTNIIHISLCLATLFNKNSSGIFIVRYRVIRRLHPDTLYQYRPEWLGRQSLDIYISSLDTSVEYQGVQHYHPVEFFGGEDALNLRQELDSRKRKACEEHGVRLVEWDYQTEPTEKNVKTVLAGE